MTRDEFDTALDWAAEEGWNPGLYDGNCFYETDPGGFLIALSDDVPVGVVSGVAYDETFGFGGFFMVREESRHHGVGTRLALEILERLGERNTGMDAVTEQQGNYRRLGFELAHRSARFEGIAPGGTRERATLADVREVDFQALARYDSLHFPARRDAFLRLWIDQPEGRGLVSLDGGDIDGYGFLRRCRSGYKLGPLFARTPSVAAVLFDALSSGVAGSSVFLDAPLSNPDAATLAMSRGMLPVFETGRMYNRKNPALPMTEIFGITSFELG